MLHALEETTMVQLEGPAPLLHFFLPDLLTLSHFHSTAMFLTTAASLIDTDLLTKAPPHLTPRRPISAISIGSLKPG